MSERLVNRDHTPRGWYCTKMNGHLGPCELWPTFWNFREWVRTGRWRLG